MRHLIILFAVGLGCVAAAPDPATRIVGGNATTVASYPEIASLMYRYLLLWWPHACGGIILTSNAILTAAHCPYGDSASQWRVRVGSSYSNSGGSVYGIQTIIIHPRFNSATNNNDIAILRTSSRITFSSVVKAALVAGPNFTIPDNRSVKAAGWGSTYSGGSTVSQLRHVEIWTVNQTTCASRYASTGAVVTEGMMCAGWLDVGGRDTCQGDSGGPLYYGRVVVGVTSWGLQCALPQYPGVYTRVSNYATWIQVTA